MKTKAIRISCTGKPEVMRLQDVDLGSPKADQVLLRHTAIGVNFIDTYHRSGLYQLKLPAGIGMEATGIVEAIGSDVSEFSVGDRVAYCGAPVGAYAEARLLSERFLLRIPEGVADRDVAASLLKGITACFLLTRTRALVAGETILWHAAAGGVGLLAVQWAKHLGARVIGTVGSKEKASLAKKYGCDHTINYRDEDVSDRVRELTEGKGVPVVYDSVGQATFEGSLRSLAKFGLLVSFGNASGPVEPFSPLRLASHGSLYFTRPTLTDHIADVQSYREMAGQVFSLLQNGVLRPLHGQEYALVDAASAHGALEGRDTVGSSILIP